MSATATPNRLSTRPMLIIGAVAGILVASAAVLWVRYGAAVFYEMVAAGIALCF